MTGRGAGPTVPATPRPTASIDTPAPVTDAGDSAGPAAETPQAGSTSGGESERFAGPPDDATTTYEDLPEDLFGESEPPPASSSSEFYAAEPGPAASETFRAPRRDERRDAAGAAAERPAANRPAANRPAANRPAADPPAAERSAPHDPAIDMVRTFFPGRIVGLEPVADDPVDEATDDEAIDDEAAVDRPDDSPDGGRDDEGPRPSG